MTAQPAPPLTTHAEPVMGTVFSFTAVHGDLPPDAVQARKDIAQRAERQEAQASNGQGSKKSK